MTPSSARRSVLLYLFAAPLVMLASLVLSAGALQAQMPHDTSQDWARAKLEASMRHREYVPVKSGSRDLNTLVIYPERKSKAPVIVLIHEIFGLSDWMKLQADELAAEGYIVVAPDLLSGLGTNGGGTDSMGGQDKVIQAVMHLDPAGVTADLDAVAGYGKSLPSASGTLFVAGFCWGGGKSFSFATHRTDLAGAFVFYGPPPPAADMGNITAPVYGFYGENDNRIDATVPQTVTDMKAAGKSYQPVTYAGAGHGFMRAGQAPDARPADAEAFKDGFARLTRELKVHSTSDQPATGPGKRRSRLRLRHDAAAPPSTLRVSTRTADTPSTLMCHNMPGM